MGSKVKEMPLKLFQKVGYSSKSSYTFAKKHPFLSGATLIFFILYMFLSYIYNFLAYLSPFLACAIIFLQIFWSSEQTQFKYVKKDEENSQSKKIESKPKIPLGSRPRRELLYKYPSQNATSRRRNFRGKRLDVYGGLEEKAKDLNAAFYNEFTSKNKPPRKQASRFEPSMRELVEGSSEIETEKIEEDEDDEETQEENKKAIEWTEDDQRNFMDLGKSDLERNKRLENLIAKRKRRKNFRFHPDTKKNGLDDKKSAMPPRNLISPVVVSRDNYFDKNVPGSAPSVMPRSPYDIPYDPFEEKMDLSGGSFSQDFVIRAEEMPSSRHGSFSSPQLPQEEHEAMDPNHVYGSGSNSHPKFRQLPDKGSHDWLVDQLMCTAAEAAKNSGIMDDQTPNPLKTGEDETTQEADAKIQSNNNITATMKDEKAEENGNNYDQTKSIASDQTRKHLPGYSSNKPPGRLLYFSLPNNSAATATATAAAENGYENFPSPISKRHEAIFFSDRRNILNNCHTPTYSIASDLQVEVSEVGSLASTVDENGESGGDESSSAEESSDERESSVLYDGDIDRDVSSGSEELWGASFHGNKQQSQQGGVNDNGDEKEDVMMMVASTSTAVGGSEAPRPASSSSSSSSSSSGSSPSKQLTRGRSVEDLSYNDTQAQVSPQEEEWSNNNLGGNNNLINGVINNLNNLIRANEQYNIENSSQSNEDHSMLLSVARQESIDENLIFSIASSPRSVLPEKTMSDDVSSPSAFDQHDEVHANNNAHHQLSTMEDLGQETSNIDELPFNTTTIPQANLPLREDSTHESHDFQLQV